MKKFLLFLVLYLCASTLRAQDPAYPAAPPAPQNIVAAEYFIDTDPGIGLATALSITPGVNITINPSNINTTGLVNGVHRIGIRTRNAEGRWSITELKSFVVDFDPAYTTTPAAPQNIIAAEYFIDTDPGAGNGQPLSLNAAVNIVDATAAISTTGLVNGVHRLYVRTKSNEGRWSITNIGNFVVDTDPPYPVAPVAPQNIIAAEYFIDTDPGIGNGQSITLSAGVDLANISAPVNTTGLSNGVHRVYIRTKSNEGRWSLTNVQNFTVDTDPAYPAAPATAQNIIAGEYFIDTDPGLGAGTPITITPGADISNIAINVDVSGLSNASHTLYVRTKSQEGKWSITNYGTFFTDLLDVLPDTLGFGNVPTGVTVDRNIIIKNYSATTQTITAINIGTNFTTDAVLPVNIPGNSSDTIKVSFTAPAVATYLDSAVLTTTSGKYTTVLTGTGIAQTYSWVLSPPAGYNYGNVILNSGASYNFTIYNSSNVPVILSNVVTNNSAFVPTFTAGTSIPVSSSITIPVVFTPTTAGQYNAQLKVLSSTPGVDSATASLSGNGYTPGAPPVLEYVQGSGFGGTTGVSPAAGPAGSFTYKILYKSVNNKAPMTGYPKVSIDLNGNQVYNDLNEGSFTMVKEGNSTDYVTGVVYSYTFSFNSNTNTAGYKFDATDEDGNAATAGVAYKAGPVVTNEVLDLRIFANDISFSNTNPQPGSTFTMTARISNSTAVPASNIPVKIYRDSILIGSTVLSSVPANGSNTINYTLNFADEGFYPIKVWIDSSQTLNESNVLNNYAIRPVTVGSPNLPGGITVTTTALRQECPQLQAIISGHAAYYGTGTSTVVAGAEVTINTGSQTFKTTTDANGNYSIVITGVTCGSGNFAYAVTITDFTFTSSPVSNSIPMPCPSPNACQPPVPAPSMGGITMSSGTGKCSNIAGGTGSLDMTIKIRERDLNNMWSPFDEVLGGTLKVFIDGVLFETRTYNQGALNPGDEVTLLLPWQIPQSTNPVTISAQLVYTYVEQEQIPNTATIRPHYITYTIDKNTIVTPSSNTPDLSAQSFFQTGYTSFRFDAINLNCVSAGSFKVKIYDGTTLIKTESISSLAGGDFKTITYSDPGMTPGVHAIKVVVDEDEEVIESDENNNIFTFNFTVIAPDLKITDISATPSLMNNGTQTQFKAVIKNTGKATGSFNVRFAVNGVQVGNKISVSGLSDDGSAIFISDAYTVTGSINTCNDVLEVFVDSDNSVAESNEGNNIKTVQLSPDLRPYQTSNETGSANNPAIVRVNNTGNFFPAIRNMGIRDAENVQVHYLLNSVEISTETIATVKAGESFAAHGAFSYMFSTPGDYQIRVVADSLGTVCETDETNNAGIYHIRVTDSKPDLVVLSQYISPSSLNPLPAQNITIVGTVRNAGGKVSTANVMRFFVDDVQLGDDVPFNAILPGKDTTVQATITYSSAIQGTKIMKIVVDPSNTMNEENELNNEATRALIVGEAPDMAKRFAQSIRFNPNGFRAGDSVTISYSIINNGTVDGSAWVRFMVLDVNNGLHAIDSVPFTLSAGANTIVSRKMYMDLIKGKVIAEIVNCTPVEYNSLNNSDTLNFSTVAPLTRSIIVNGNLDLRQGIPDDVPGWIGGKLLLGDFDLTVNGEILNADIEHFIVTDGTGKLKMVNNNTENIFPVAADTSHGNFVKIANSGTPDNFSVRIAPYVLKAGNNGDTVRTGNVNRTWFIEEQTPGGSNATLTFLWNQQDEQPGFDRAQSAAAHYIASWQMGTFGAAVVDTAGRFSKSQGGYSSFSPFTVTTLNNALPLRLLQFEATQQHDDALLKWETTDEINTSHFDIEYSTNGRDFSTIGKVMANNTAGTQRYSFIHSGLQTGDNYYRLKMTDIDGKFTYSAVKRLSVTEKMELQAYPNPARYRITVKGLAPGGTLELLTIDGKRLQQLKTSANTMIVQLGNITSGIYIIRYYNNKQTKQVRIMKE